MKLFICLNTKHNMFIQIYYNSRVEIEPTHSDWRSDVLTTGQPWLTRYVLEFFIIFV